MTKTSLDALGWRSLACVGATLLTGIVVVAGCGSEVGDGDAAANDGGGSSSSEGGSSGFVPTGDSGYQAGDGAVGTCVPFVAPDGTTPACANCEDDDGDGLVDWLDPECAGPFDNDEKTFGTGIAGDNVDACKQDCFFDGNSGQGDDKCEWNLKCDPKITTGACVYDPGFTNCPGTQSATCIEKCQKVTPNGCDCFGCCAVAAPNGTTSHVRLVGTCSVADLGDPAKCPPCTPVPSCANPCDRCELCIGKTSIPADCNADAGGSGQTCSDGQACNATTPCPGGTYCVTGCCIPVVN